MDYFLGLDGGGTKTAAVILSGSGEELGRGRGGPCNIATCSDEQLTASVSEARSTALTAAGLPAETRFIAVCAGVAGYTARRRRAEFTSLLEVLISAERHRVEPDFTIAYWGATEGQPGIIVSAGTGTVVYGSNADGRTCRVDGRGFLLGDRGSAFDLGRKILYNLMEKLDYDLPLEELDVNVLEALGANDADDLIEWTYRDFSPSRIASIAGMIGQFAAAGDTGAIARLRNQGQALRTSLETARWRLNAPEDIPVYLLGSLWAVGEPLLDGFTRGGFRSTGSLPPVQILTPLHDPAYGAALLALRGTNGTAPSS